MGERTMMKYFFMYTKKKNYKLLSARKETGYTDTEKDLGEGYLQLWSVKWIAFKLQV